MRFVAVILMFLFAGAAVLVPAPVPEEHAPNPGTATPPISTCPLVAGSGRTTDIAVLSSVDGPGRVSTFSSGNESGSVDFRTGITGSVVIDASEAGAAGVSGGLIEMPTVATASGVTITGETSHAAEACADIATGQAFLSGGSTASGATFEVQLLNPYAGEGVVELTVTSDAGIESDQRFDSVIVPALSTVNLNISQIIPGREEVSVNVEVTAGSVLAVGRQSVNGRTVVWRAVEAVQDWWLPVPQGGGTKQLLLATPANTEVEYWVDYYGEEGLQEAFRTGVLEPRGRQRIGLAAISPDTAAVRIISSGPVVPTLWIESAEGFALTTASPVDATTWLLPGAQSPPGGAGRVVVFNTGIEEVTVDVRSLHESVLSRSFTLPAEEVLDVPMISANGYRVEATGPVVALWTSQLGGDGTAAMGVPIQDG